MAALDTNVLVRWLVADDTAQAELAKSLLESAIAAEASLFVPLTVMLELEWVLRSRYGLDKSAIVGTFNALLETRELVFHEEGALERALQSYRNTNTDFADCLHAGVCAAHGQSPL